MSSQQPAPLPHIGLALTSSFAVAADYGTYSVSGQDAGLDYAPGNVASTAQPASLPHLSLLVTPAEASSGNAAPFPFLANLFDRVLAADYGEYAITGVSTVDNRLYADYGSYFVGGRSAEFLVETQGAGDAAPLPSIGLLLGASTLARTLTADTGLYTFELSEVLADFEVTAELGGYVTTGQSANTLGSFLIGAESGAYTFSGQDAALDYGSTARTLTADQGTYSVTGSDAGLYAGYVVTAEQGFSSIQGRAADLYRGYGFPCDTGTYDVSGQDAILYYQATYNLSADVGSYGITGFETNPEENPTTNNHPGPARWKVVYNDRQRAHQFGKEKVVYEEIVEEEEEKPRKPRRQVTVIKPAPPKVIEEIPAEEKQYASLQRELEIALLNSRMLANANKELQERLDKANAQVVAYANKTMAYADSVLAYANNVVKTDETDIEELLKDY